MTRQRRPPTAGYGEPLTLSQADDEKGRIISDGLPHVESARTKGNGIGSGIRGSGAAQSTTNNRRLT